jgi:hypothetical protein
MVFLHSHFVVEISTLSDANNQLAKLLPSRSPKTASGAFSNTSTTFMTEVFRGRGARARVQNDPTINDIVLEHGVYLV